MPLTSLSRFINNLKHAPTSTLSDIIFEWSLNGINILFYQKVSNKDYFCVSLLKNTHLICYKETATFKIMWRLVKMWKVTGKIIHRFYVYISNLFYTFSNHQGHYLSNTSIFVRDRRQISVLTLNEWINFYMSGQKKFN